MSVILKIGVNPQSLLHKQINAGVVDPDSLEAPVATEDVKSYQPPTHTYASCFGLPYQDHNYGAPPPPTPPASPPPAPPRVNGHIDIEDIESTTEVVTTTEIATTPMVAATAPDNVDVGNMDDSVTRCICDFEHDDGYMICCDKCSVWQHVDCMGVDRQNIPDNYMCEKCEPRKVDKQRAIQIQTRKRDEIAALDSSATETEDETVRLGITPASARKNKTRRKKKERDRVIKGSKKIKKNKKDKTDKKKDKANKQQGKNKMPRAIKRTMNRREKVSKQPLLSPNVTINEDARDPYDFSASLETYEEARTNHYSVDIQSLLANKKFNGQHDSVEFRPSRQLLAQLCRVAQVNPNRKGLESTEEVAQNQLIVEYKGKVMLREQYDKENLFFKKIHPFVLFYHLDNLDLCVDASVYGNDARFVRRSCTPNAEVRHHVSNGKVLFHIHSLKEITKGAEITIPFDFNYQECNYDVDCACSRLNCPVGKFHRKEENRPGRGKRKRGLKSVDQKAAVSIESPESKSTAPPPRKRRKSAPLSEVSTSANKQQQSSAAADAAVVAAAAPAEPAPVPPPTSPALTPRAARNRRKSEPQSVTSHTSPPPPTPPTPPAPLATNAHSTPSSSPVKEKEKDKVNSAASTPKTTPKAHKGEDSKLTVSVVSPPATPAPMLHSPNCPTTPGFDESDAEAAERRKKMTREERKMEAIMKAFEKMEKREERRKEALARMETTRKSVDEQKEPMEPPKEVAATKKKVKVEEPPKPEPVKQEDIVDEVKQETPPPKVEVPKLKGKGKKKKGPARRRSRMNSSASGTSSAAEPPSSADESSNLTAPPTPIPALIMPPAVNPSAENSNSSSNAPQSAPVMGKAFRFPKTKKHLMNEWFHEKAQDLQKPLTITTELPEEHSQENAEFVKCVPSPHTSSLSHLRRSSMSACNQTKAAAVTAVSNMDSSMGSAKKRWLRQAMFESTGTGGQLPAGAMSPVPSGSMSPNPNLTLTREALPCSNSPGNSPPVDFVTPLKKRRFARESLSLETSPYPPTPSTPTAAQQAPDFGALTGTSEGMVSEGEKSASDSEGPVPLGREETSNYLPNGIKPHPPLMPSDNLFEKFKFAAGKGDGVLDKQESRDSSMSDSLLSPHRDSFMTEADSGFLSPSINVTPSHSHTTPYMEHVQPSVQPSVQHSVQHSVQASIKQEVTETKNTENITEQAPQPGSEPEDLHIKAEVDQAEWVAESTGLISVIKEEESVKQEHEAMADEENNLHTYAEKSLDSVNTHSVTLNMNVEDGSPSQESDPLQKQDDAVETEKDSSEAQVCVSFDNRASNEDPEDSDEHIDVDTIDACASDDTVNPYMALKDANTQASTSCENITSVCIENGFTMSSVSKPEETDAENEDEGVALQSEEAERLNTANRSLEEGEIETDTSMEVEASSEAAPRGSQPPFGAHEDMAQVNSSRQSPTNTHAVGSGSVGEAGVSTSEQLVSCSSEADVITDSVADKAHSEAAPEVDSSIKHQVVMEEGELSESEADMSREEMRVGSAKLNEESVQDGDEEDEEMKEGDTSGSDLVSSSSGRGNHSTQQPEAGHSSPSPSSSLPTANSHVSNQVSPDKNSFENDAIPRPSCSSSSAPVDSEHVDSTWNNSSCIDSSSNIISSSSNNGCMDYSTGPSSSVVLDMDQIEETGSKEEPCSSSALTESDDMYISGTPRRDSVWYNNCSSSSSSIHSNSGATPQTDSTTTPSGVVTTSLSPSSLLGSSSSSSLPRLSLSFASNVASNSSQAPNTQSASIASYSTLPPTKKKVSLLEYRKRMKERANSTSGDGQCKTPVSSTSSSPGSAPTLAPLPLFDSISSSADRVRSRGLSLSPLPSRRNTKDDNDVRWGTPSSSSDRPARDPTPLSLNERLRREFGIEASESEEEEEKSKGDWQQEKDRETPPPPPPPPPPPRPGHLAQAASRGEGQTLYQHQSVGMGIAHTPLGVPQMVPPPPGMVVGGAPSQVPPPPPPAQSLLGASQQPPQQQPPPPPPPPQQQQQQQQGMPIPSLMSVKSFPSKMFPITTIKSARREGRWETGENRWDGATQNHRHHGRSTPPPPPPPPAQTQASYSAAATVSSSQYSAIPTTYQQHPAHTPRPTATSQPLLPHQPASHPQATYESYSTSNHHSHYAHYQNYQNTYHPPPQ